MCIQTGKTLEDDARMRMETRRALCQERERKCVPSSPSCPDAVDNTTKIAERCQVEFEFGVTRLPHYPVPNRRNASVHAEPPVHGRHGSLVSRSEGGRRTL